MLGLTQSENPISGKLRVELYAIATLLLILFINIVYELYLLLPDIPTYEQFYGIAIKSLFLTLAIYAVNKGIQWRQSRASA